ncbi:hypothetical protein Gbfr_012_164 [Gluconobacter frateurii M-2]|nr:hypothetical protein Gbfr_012_164 [Gluconobacter frateurii M-2]
MLSHHPKLNRRSFLMAGAVLATTTFARSASGRTIKGLEGLTALLEVWEDKWGVPPKQPP